MIIDDRFDKLPKWAQVYIRDLERWVREVDEKEALLKNGFQPRWKGDKARAFLVDYSTTGREQLFPIGGNFAQVRFEADDSAFICRLTEHGGVWRLQVVIDPADSGGNYLAIEPAAANTVFIGVAAEIKQGAAE